MTLSIHVEAHPDRGDMGQQVETALAAIGFHRTLPGQITSSQARHLADHVVSSVSQANETLDGYKVGPVDAEALTAVGERVAETQAEAPKRERGKPSQGRARRTKEEIAEDEAADAADAAKQQAAEEADLKDDVKLAVSTGEERIGPDDAQDAADEAAETEKTGLAPIDVLRRLVGDYQKKHGMPAAVKLCQEGGLIGKPIHELDDTGIEAAIAAMQGGKAPTAEQKTEKPATLEPKTKADLLKAMGAYSAKFDGYEVKNFPPTPDDAKNMTFTLLDCPKIFAATFGDSVQKLSQVPEDKYAEAVAAVEAAIKADPYGRAK